MLRPRSNAASNPCGPNASQACRTRWSCHSSSGAKPFRRETSGSARGNPGAQEPDRALCVALVEGDPGEELDGLVNAENVVQGNMCQVRQVAESSSEGLAFVEHDQDVRCVTLVEPEVAVDEQGVDALGAGFEIRGQEPVEPVAAFAELAAANPEDPQIRGHAQPCSRLVRRGEAGLECGPYIGLLGADQTQQAHLVRAEPVGAHIGGKSGVIVPVRGAGAAVRQLLAPVLLDRLEHVVPMAVEDNDRLCHELSQGSFHLGSGQVIAGADRADGGQVGTGGKHRQPGPEDSRLG